MRRTLTPAVLSLALLTAPAALPAAPPTPAPGLPKEAHPLSPALAKHMDELVHAAEEYRGLRLARPVPYGALGERDLKAKVAETIAEDLPADELRALETSLKAFGLVPKGADVGKIYRDLLAQQVAAYYDPERKYLVMVERQGENGAEALDKVVGADLARRAEEGILVHELTHAIDDQHFDIGKGGKGSKGDPLADASSAYLALVEGDATVTMFDYILDKRIEAVPGFGRMMGDMLKDPGQLAGLSPDLPGSAGFADAPAWFRDTLVFSYLQGFTFCLDVERTGGQKLLDYAFAKDPPRSTEQILHPEKWYGRRDDPIALSWPDLTAALPGWKKAAEGEMGEEGIGILLRQELQDSNLAASAAAGWGGDRFAVYTKEGRRLLLWATEWDTEADAAEFVTAASRLPQGGAGWRVARSSPTRVVLSRGGFAGTPPETQARVEAALGAIPARRPANKDIDFAALGIAKPAAAEPKPAAPAPGPAPRKAAAEVSSDGRTYTNHAAGFSFRLPAARAGWEIDPQPGEGNIVQIFDDADSTYIVVSSEEESEPVRLEEYGKMIPKVLAGDQGHMGKKDVRLRTLGSRLVERAGTRAYEVEMEADEGVRLLSRAYAQGSSVILVTCFAPADRWTALERPVREIFDSFAVLPAPTDSAPPPAPPH